MLKKKSQQGEIFPLCLEGDHQAQLIKFKVIWVVTKFDLAAKINQRKCYVAFIGNITGVSYCNLCPHHLVIN